MKHNPSNRRSRSRGNKQRHSGGRNNYESNGPGGKVRGTVQQVLDKYLALARDAQSSGDRISAESFYQFAEHYFRVLNVEGSNGQVRRDKSSIEPGEQSATVAEGNSIESGPENVQNNADDIANVMDASAIDPADQSQPEIGSNITDTISPSIDTESEVEPKVSSERKVSRRRRTEPESASEEVEASTAS